jgi:RNA recognition motif-containing protein
MNIYVGNLSRETSQDDIRRVFEPHGTVDTVNIIVDRYTGESRGFGFVEMPSKEEGERAIAALDGTELNGRTLKVNIARPRTQNRDRGRW